MLVLASNYSWLSWWVRFMLGANGVHLYDTKVPEKD